VFHVGMDVFVLCIQCYINNEYILLCGKNILCITPFVILRPKLRYRYTRVEAGSNTSTVTLRVVGGDEKGSLKSETVKSGHESYGTRTRK
jgi:hypothetical protein